MTGRPVGRGARPRTPSMDECIDAARLCDAVLDALRTYVPHDDAIRSLEHAVEASRLEALEAAEAAIPSSRAWGGGGA